MAQIEKAQTRAATKYELAKAIRKLLDDARKAYGPTEWDEDGVEAEVIELVTEES